MNKGKVQTEERFIPARAGNAMRLQRFDSRDSVHPRAGGERQSYAKDMTSGFGSSPRGRGTLRYGLRRDGRNRFIPARAGNAAGGRIWSGPRPVHPRAGGERDGGMRIYSKEIGSSPRGRGTHRGRRRLPLRRRFIPARAGNAPCRAAGSRRRSVHPRAGGERAVTVRLVVVVVGSSPRGRGTLFLEGVDRKHDLRCQRAYGRSDYVLFWWQTIRRNPARE